MRSSTMQSSLPNRWVLAITAFLMQLALGSVYAWSVFLKPAGTVYHVSRLQANLTFSIVLLALGVTAGFGGYLTNRFGPRVIATLGGLLYGLGVILAAFAAPNIFILYLTFGILGEIGIGLGYIVALAMLIKWFPDRRGFITGLAVAGFGAGALITSPVAASLITSVGLGNTFLYLGIAYLVVIVIVAQFFRTAPDGCAPAGWTPSARQQTDRARRDYTLPEALRLPRWYVLWLILALNATAGAALISVASPLAQKFTGVGAVTAALLVSVIGIFNGAGRLFWGWLSDGIGRPFTFLSMFIIKVKELGAKVIHLDPHYSRTSALANLYVPTRAGTDIVFLGAVIHHILETERYFHDYAVNYTNAATMRATRRRWSRRTAGCHANNGCKLRRH